MKRLTLIAALALCGCDRAAEQPGFFLNQTTEYPDGTVRTVTYSGPVPPVNSLANHPPIINQPIQCKDFP